MLDGLEGRPLPGAEARMVRPTPPTKGAADARGCFCDLWERSPALLERQDLPRGYCGRCSWCGKPGHTRHFPGAVGYTGAWCDWHYRVLSIVHPLGVPGVAVYAAVGVAALFAWWALRH